MAANSMTRAGGGLAFLNTNRAATAFDTTTKALQATRKQEQADAVDAATRDALLQTYGRPQQPAAQPAPQAPAQPSPTPEGGSAPAPATPPPAPAAPAQSSNPYGDAIARLAATPGAGAAALRLAQQGERMGASQRREQERLEQRVLVAVAQGDMAAAEHWAQRSGNRIPPHVMQNSGLARQAATAKLLAGVYYPDRQQQATYMHAWTNATGGPAERHAAAVAAAGAPMAPRRVGGSGGGGGGGAGSRGGALRLTTIDTPDGPVRAWVDPRNPDRPAMPVLAPGQTRPPAGAAPAPAPMPTGRDGEEPAPAPAASPYARVPQRPARGTGGGETREQFRYRKAIEAGATPQEAAAIVAGMAPSPATLDRSQKAIRAAIVATTPGSRLTPAQLEEAVAQQMEANWGSNWLQMMRGTRTPTQPKPAPPPQQPPAQRDTGALGRVQAPNAPQVTTDGQTALTSTPSGTAGGSAPAAPAAPRPTMTPPRVAPTGPAPAAAPPAATVPGPTVLPPEAMARLREGVTTTFGNGQKWTLRGGQPVQVQ